MFSRFLQRIRNNFVSISVTIVLSTVLFFSYVLFVKPEISGTQFEFIGDPLITTIVVALLISLLSKLNIIISTESIVNTIQENLGILSDLISGSQTYGIMGVDSDFDEFTHIQALETGHILYWLDTRVSGKIDDAIPIIRSALENGAIIELLFMHPQNPALPQRFAEMKSPMLYEDYEQNFNAQRNALLALKEEAKKKKWKLKVGFYRDLPGSPIFIVRQGDHEIAYTGYYLNGRANTFPRMKWHSGSKSFIDQLQKHFNDKLKRALDEDNEKE